MPEGRWPRKAVGEATRGALVVAPGSGSGPQDSENHAKRSPDTRPASSGTGGHGGIGGKLSGFLYSLAGILNWEILLFRPAVEPLGLPEKNLRIWNVSSNNFYIAIITDI